VNYQLNKRQQTEKKGKIGKKGYAIDEAIL